MDKSGGLQSALEERQREREAGWRKHLEAWRSGGRSQAEYCRQHDLSPADFSYWKHELVRRDVRAKKSVAPDATTFMPVKLVTDFSSEAWSGEVVLRNGRRLRLSAGVSAQWVAELAAALERHAPC